jgi:cation:H+ antiporter
MFLAVVKLTIGLVLLVGGAELLTKACIRIAQGLGITPLVIGLTIVAFGTSAPELSVSIMAALNGQPDISIGNVVGSNIANLGLILGFGAMIAPLGIPRRILKVEIPFLMVSVAALAVAAWCHELGRVYGAAFLAGFSGYLYYLYIQKKALSEPYMEEMDGQGKAAGSPLNLLLQIPIIAASFTALIYGSKFLVSGAVFIAHHFNCPELIIGLTVTAIGTSLPELATTFSAARQGHGALVIGNVLGSNLANVYGVLGLTGLIHPIPINHEVIVRDMPVMALFTLALVPIMKSGKRVTRLEGLFLLGAYLCYICLLYFQS